MMNKWYQCITCQKCDLTGSRRHRTNAKSHLIESGLLPDKKMCFFPIQLTYYLLKALDLIVGQIKDYIVYKMRSISSITSRSILACLNSLKCGTKAIQIFVASRAISSSKHEYTSCEAIISRSSIS